MEAQTILVVDDDPHIREVIRFALEQPLGFCPAFRHARRGRTAPYIPKPLALAVQSGETGRIFLLLVRQEQFLQLTSACR